MNNNKYLPALEASIVNSFFSFKTICFNPTPRYLTKLASDVNTGKVVC